MSILYKWVIVDLCNPVHLYLVHIAWTLAESSIFVLYCIAHALKINGYFSIMFSDTLNMKC